MIETRIESPLVTWRLSFYNPHNTAWKAGPINLATLGPAAWLCLQDLAKFPVVGAGLIAIFLNSQEH
jgi:hypothetical protein